MRTGYVTMMLVLILLIAPGAYAASGRCKVSKVEGSTVVLQCDRTEGFSQGKEVKVKTTRPPQK